MLMTGGLDLFFNESALCCVLWLSTIVRVVCVMAAGDQQLVSWPPGTLVRGGTAGLYPAG